MSVEKLGADRNFDSLYLAYVHHNAQAAFAHCTPMHTGRRNKRTGNSRIISTDVNCNMSLIRTARWIPINVCVRSMRIRGILASSVSTGTTVLVRLELIGRIPHNGRSLLKCATLQRSRRQRPCTPLQ